MNKGALDEIIKLTQKCITEFWNKNSGPMTEYMAWDVLWIGAQRNQFITGREEAKKDVERVVSEMISCTLSCQEFFAVSNRGSCCTIAGRYIATTNEGAPLRAQQRFTFVWEMAKDKVERRPEIKLIHISNPIGELRADKDESFVNKIGEMTSKYLRDKIEYIKKDKQLYFYDKKNNVRFISAFEIEYAESNKRTVIIHTTENIFEVKIKWSDFLKMTEGMLVQTHRNYAVNPMYISAINKTSIVMLKGDVIPVPVKKAKEVYEKIREFNNI